MMNQNTRLPGFTGHVCVLDVGSHAKLGWAMEGAAPRDGRDLDGCIAAVAAALAEGPVALGFEAPLFVPYRNDPLALSRARDGECPPGRRPRPFSAQAGATVATIATVVAPYALRRLRQAAPATRVTLDWTVPMTGAGDLLLFEAFVTDQPAGRDDPHVADARLAARTLLSALRSGRVLTSVRAEPCFNLLGAALLRTGWTSDLGVLAAPLLVVRPA